MSEISVTYKEVHQELQNSSRVRRGLHRVFPKIVSRSTANRLHRIKQEEVEIERREALGPKGRIVEDAVGAVHGSLPGNLKLHKRHREQGRFMPVGEHPDSFASYTRTIDRYLAESGDGKDNVLGRMESPRFGFAVGINDDGVEAMDDENYPEVYLIGLSEDNGTILESYKLEDAYFDTLSAADLGVLERAAYCRRVDSQHQAFRDHTDKYI